MPALSQRDDKKRKEPKPYQKENKQGEKVKGRKDEREKKARSLSAFWTLDSRLQTLDSLLCIHRLAKQRETIQVSDIIHRVNHHPAAGGNRDLADAGVADLINLAELAYVQATAVQQKSPHRSTMSDNHDLFTRVDFSDLFD